MLRLHKLFHAEESTVNGIQKKKKIRTCFCFYKFAVPCIGLGLERVKNTNWSLRDVHRWLISEKISSAYVCRPEISVRTASTGDRWLRTPHDNYFGQRKRIDENIVIYIYIWCMCACIYCVWESKNHEATDEKSENQESRTAWRHARQRGRDSNEYLISSERSNKITRVDLLRTTIAAKRRTLWVHIVVIIRPFIVVIIIIIIYYSVVYTPVRSARKTTKRLSRSCLRAAIGNINHDDEKQDEKRRVNRECRHRNYCCYYWLLT